MKINQPTRRTRPGAGRPLGSPNKLTRSLKELASRYGPDALCTLVTIMNDGESETARIATAREILDRGYGKPRVAVELAQTEDQIVLNGKADVIDGVVTFIDSHVVPLTRR